MIRHDLRLLPLEPDETYAAYRARTGPDSLARARALTPERIIDEIDRSGLRGRGGAGFPTGVKWRTIQQHRCTVHDVVCNAAEGEPGTFKDRWLLRRNPYATLEGMLIAAHIVRARTLYVAVKASFRPEIARLRRAIEELRSAGVLASLDVRLVEGPEEYLFGEEKALLEVIEGNDPMPREADRPPFEEGLFATLESPNPALVNNAETFAHVPAILRFGAAVFRALGTEDTPGTLLFTLSGDVQRPGIYEAPAGITLRELFEDLAGGPRPGRTLRAAISGVSNGVMTADRFDVRADFASLHLAGSGLGSAGFVVLDDRASLPRAAQAVARFLYVESCNQCSACKSGLRLASRAMDRALTGKGRPQDLEWVRSGALAAPQGNRCALPSGAAALIPTLLGHFEADFQAAVGRAAQSPPWPIPKFVDYDEATHTFLIDEHQQHKRPDWTYETGTPTGTRPQPAAQALDAGHLHAHLPLSAELLEELAQHAKDSGATLAELAEAAVRKWLPRRKRGKRPGK